ncbi:hypothetical protein R2601_04473 [Salipiger bermudensis HTCC2601]|uniref:Uncharacterized protein n=1 Tax=Salipiger bermudensis (strain DSM 26914 / JCM 13377 / KCTC 12554 / HTCC2601) TaxID=314265 RepID=Q0FVV1_SALBH|nr:hypothetical protein R2601_04473 [Salipiger bermudensis HTCC2601]
MLSLPLFPARESSSAPPSMVSP